MPWEGEAPAEPMMWGRVWRLGGSLALPDRQSSVPREMEDLALVGPFLSVSN
jgi:hypothetical protein